MYKGLKSLVLSKLNQEDRKTYTSNKHWGWSVTQHSLYKELFRTRLSLLLYPTRIWIRYCTNASLFHWDEGNINIWKISKPKFQISIEF